MICYIWYDCVRLVLICFLFKSPATTGIYTYCLTLSLHDALPICPGWAPLGKPGREKVKLAMISATRQPGTVSSSGKGPLACEPPCPPLLMFLDRKSTRLNSSHKCAHRMQSSARNTKIRQNM